VYLYKNSYYGGAYTIIWGDSGMCDSSGYLINLAQSSSAWAFSVSSTKGASLCNVIQPTTVYNNQAVSTYRCQPWPTMGIYNDKLLHMQVNWDPRCP